MSFFDELKRRNVFRVGAAYLVLAWLLLQITDVIAPILRLPDSVPRLVLLLLFVGFFPALIFAWAYELTPQGLKREADVDRANSITRRTGRKLDVIIIALMGVAIVYLVLDNYVLDRGPLESSDIDRSIAVLPFRNRSTLSEDAFFADGIHDDLLTQLSRMSSLDKVISRTSTERYRDTVKPVREIGEELGVANIVEGGVQRAGNQVRINVQLIDSRTDEHIWAATYDKKLTIENLFDIQTEITREIVASLHGVLSDDDVNAMQSIPTTNLQAYEQFTLGRVELGKRTRDSIARAKEHFEKAIELDPGYALAYVGLADAYALMPEHAGAVFEDTVVPRQQALNQALMLDPASGEAYTNLANLKARQGETEQAEEYFLRAIELSPRYPTAYHWYSLHLRADIRLEEALLMVRKAIELDPMGDTPWTVYAGLLRILGRPEEAKSVTRSSIERNPEFAGHYENMSRLLEQEGRLADALKWALEAVRLSPGKRINLAQACRLRINLADYSGAEQCIDELEQRFPDRPGTERVSLLYFRGQVEDAVALAESIADSRPSGAGVLASVYVAAGRLDEARKLFSKLQPELLGEEDVMVELSNVNVAITVATLLYNSGEKERANFLFDRALDVLESLHRTRGLYAGISDVRIHAVRGDQEKAVAALREAYDTGYMKAAKYLQGSEYDRMNDNAEWVALVEQFEAELARQRHWYDKHKDDPLL